MAGHDDYDYDEDRDPRDDCEHEHVQIDVCTGRATCECCSHHWYLTDNEIKTELDRQASYHEEMERENLRQRRREFWARITFPIRWPIFRLLEKIWPRKSIAVLLDDEIPF
jgi:hypothetical protein